MNLQTCVFFSMVASRRRAQQLTVWELKHGDASLEIGEELLTRDELATALQFTVRKIEALSRNRFIPNIRLAV